MPLQGHMVVLEPCICRHDTGVDEAGVEEGVELGEEECQVREPRHVDLESISVARAAETERTRTR